MKKKTRDEMISRALIAMRDEPDIDDRYAIWVQIEGLLYEWKDMSKKKLKKQLPDVFIQ